MVEQLELESEGMAREREGRRGYYKEWVGGDGFRRRKLPCVCMCEDVGVGSFDLFHKEIKIWNLDFHVMDVL